MQHNYSLQALSRVFAVYGSVHLYESQVANEIYQAVFSGIANLNPWRLRVFIHIHVTQYYLHDHVTMYSCLLVALLFVV